jgi:hypothetical protein
VKKQLSLFPLLLLTSVLTASCGPGRTTDLATLVHRDSTYLTPGSLKPFSGRVVRHFDDDPGKVQIEGTLENGVWEGEMTVYHESGRIRYQGRLSRGAPCGTWLENRDDEVTGSVFDELKKDIASMGVYPDCP